VAATHTFRWGDVLRACLPTTQLRTLREADRRLNKSKAAAKGDVVWQWLDL